MKPLAFTSRRAGCFSTLPFIYSFTIQDIKTILPYAGAALLGIAAALAVNPRLLSRITGHVDSNLYGNANNNNYGGSYGGYSDLNKYNNYGSSGYGQGYAHHHGRKRREAERKFGQKMAYHHTKRN
jgi:hypothetical protein